MGSGKTTQFLYTPKDDDMSIVISCVGYESLLVDISPVPFRMKATHDPAGTADGLRREVEVPRADEDEKSSEYLKAS